MILSMTGHGEATYTEDGVYYALEIRSLNNRYFKAVIKLPDSIQFLEPDLDKLLRSRLSRGTVTVNLRVRNQTAAAAFDINHEALKAYATALGKASTPDGVPTSLDLAVLATLPGVCQAPQADDAVRVSQREVVLRLVSEAVERLIEMRRREGRSLYDDLLAHCAQIGERLDGVSARAPVVLGEYHERLTQRVEQLRGDGKLELDRDAISREVALYADRCDISEEIVRERAHVEHFIELCESDRVVGRRLDFLAQEMLREVNTIGSKSNDPQIARTVVELKTVVDRIKEQVQNVE